MGAPRYEIRDIPLKASKKRFHVVDLTTGREVLHTDNRDRALQLIELAGNGPVDQHLKDRGHLWVTSSRLGRCAVCEPKYAL
jgi:hypothetical protein